MTRGQFYKSIRPGVLPDGKCLCSCDGYIDREIDIAYSLNPYAKTISAKWVSTDLYTGVAIAYGSTKQECIDNTAKVMPRLEQCRNDYSTNDGKLYVSYIKTFERLKEKEINNHAAM